MTAVTNIRLLKTESDYEKAMARFDELMALDPDRDTPDGDEFEALSLLIREYEIQHTDIASPDPVDYLLHVMERRGLTRKDLEPYIGSRGQVSKVLNMKRPLSLRMMRRLHSGLGIPADVLLKNPKMIGQM